LEFARDSVNLLHQLSRPIVQKSNSRMAKGEVRPMRKKTQLIATIILLFTSFPDGLWSQRGSGMSFTLSTKAFTEGGTIPKKYTCDGDDVSPGLAWTGVPPGAQALALIADDPDAPVGTWTHWISWNIRPDRALPEGVPKNGELSDGMRQGRNDFKRVGYGGPCPPPGKPHRYFFKLYALDAKVDLKPESARTELESAMKGHVLAEAQVMGRYGR
jgi:Raf kinase inhibitor-like YbhB/YbcL family protein